MGKSIRKALENFSTLYYRF